MVKVEVTGAGVMVDVEVVIDGGAGAPAVAIGWVPSGQVSGGIAYVSPSEQQMPPGGIHGCDPSILNMDGKQTNDHTQIRQHTRTYGNPARITTFLATLQQRSPPQTGPKFSGRDGNNRGKKEQEISH